MESVLCGSLEGGNDKRNGKDEPQLKMGKNSHPTVKPLALMEYLIKLITPLDGIVLDMFMGSGSTGVACKNLNRKFIGIDLNKTYIDMAIKRIGNTSRMML